MHQLRWFKNRIGKRIYRHTDTKCCPHCDDVLKNGLIVGNESHADYLHCCQGEMGLIYSDKKL